MSANTPVREMLAVEGGEPVRDTLLPYGRQAIDEEDIQAVVETLRSDWLTTGPKVDEFEEAFAAWVGAKHAISFSSGTAALHGAAFAAGLGPGDEAITSPLTFAATANCVLYQGATPVFADVSPDTLTLDPEQVAFGINSRTRAILPVDYAGAISRTPRRSRNRRRLSRVGRGVRRQTNWKPFAYDSVQLSPGKAHHYG